MNPAGIIIIVLSCLLFCFGVMAPFAVVMVDYATQGRRPPIYLIVLLMLASWICVQGVIYGAKLI